MYSRRVRLTPFQLLRAKPRIIDLGMSVLVGYIFRVDSRACSMAHRGMSLQQVGTRSSAGYVLAGGEYGALDRVRIPEGQLRGSLLLSSPHLTRWSS